MLIDMLGHTDNLRRPYLALRRALKAKGYGARAGEVIAGNLKRGGDGKFTSAGGAGDTEKPEAEKPEADAADQRQVVADARAARADAEAATREQEDADEQAARDAEDARLNKITDRTERNKARQEIARARRERAGERRKARAERARAERAARRQESADLRAGRPPKKASAAKPKPKKAGGGKGGSAAPPAADPVRQQRDQERQQRQAEIQRRRAEAAEREQRRLTDLAQRATGSGARLTSSQWERLIVAGLAQRQGAQLRLTSAGQAQARRQPQQVKTFRVFKDRRGADRWIAISSSAFRDRDDEIVMLKALADDCAYADATGDYGPLRWWHLPGVDIGDCDFNAVSGRCLIEMGTFRHPALARAAAKAAPDLELSLGFWHKADEPGPDGAYTFIRRFERSLAPKGRASNLLTAFDTFAVTKEDRMSPEKLKAALEKLGTSPEARAVMESIIGEAQQREKALDAAGIAYKDAPTWAQGLIARIDALEARLTAEKAPMPPAEMEAAGATELEDGAAELDMDESTDDAGEFVGDMTPDAFKALIKGVIVEALGDMSTRLATLDGELKAMGYERRMKAQDERIETIGKTAAAILATVKELNGDAPARRGHRATLDNPDLDPALAAILKEAQETGDLVADPSDPYAAVMQFLRPAA